MIEMFISGLVGIAIGVMTSTVIALALLMREPKSSKPLTKEEWKVSDYEN